MALFCVDNGGDEAKVIFLGKTFFCDVGVSKYGINCTEGGEGGEEWQIDGESWFSINANIFSEGLFPVSCARLNIRCEAFPSPFIMSR
jgi:hypothetical protein